MKIIWIIIALFSRSNKIFEFKTLTMLKLFRKSQIHQIQEEQIVLRKKKGHFSLKVTKTT